MALRFLIGIVVLLCTLLFSFFVIAQEASLSASLHLFSQDSISYSPVLPSDSSISEIAQPIQQKNLSVDTVIPQLQKIVVTSGSHEQLLESNRSVLIIGPDEWIGTNKSVADVIAEHTGIRFFAWWFS